MLNILNNIDRRIIYLLLSVVVILPLILDSKIDIYAETYRSFNIQKNGSRSWDAIRLEFKECSRE